MLRVDGQASEAPDKNNQLPDLCCPLSVTVKTKRGLLVLKQSSTKPLEPAPSQARADSGILALRPSILKVLKRSSIKPLKPPPSQARTDSGILALRPAILKFLKQSSAPILKAPPSQARAD
ncbi:hypothetical protein J6590_104664 [Homalodisca vitripennis]|nr:hypothetical protein J6590_104664 [Homalodisca vitripennis]